MSRVLPTAPGWWWAQWRGSLSQPVEAWMAADGLRADDPTNDEMTHRVAHKGWTWLEPIPAPGALVGEVYAGEVFPDAIGMSVALPLETTVTIGARVRVYIEEAP